MDCQNICERSVIDSGVCLLSLDGSEAGTTELSELMLLQEIAHRIEHDAKLNRTPLPWEYFDLIGGSGMGGVFALLLAVWRLSVDDVIVVYSTLHVEVFSSEAWSNGDIELSSRIFDSTFRKIATSLGRDADESLVNESADACKAFVCTSNPVNMSLPRLFRTYKARSNRLVNCSVSESIFASIGGPPHLQPVILGEPPEQFISAVHRINNPSFEVLREAQSIFGAGRHVACLVSIGAGQQEPLASESHGPYGLGPFERIARDTEAAVQELERRLGGADDLFFRLNVLQGLQKTSVARETLSTVSMHSKQYLSVESVGKKVDALVRSLLMRPRKVQLARMNSVVGPDAHDFTTSVKLHIALDCLPYIDGASYNSEAGCMEGTRIDLLSRIDSWIESARSSSTAEVLLLSAVTGAGKSAVAHTVARMADDRGILACSFFFQRGVQRRDSARFMLSTLIKDLAGRSQSFGELIGATINEDRSIASANLQRQFKKLLISHANALSNSKPMVIVIDALDEIRDENELRQFLHILRDQTPELPNNLRIFTTSRVIQPVEQALPSHVSHIKTETINTQTLSNQDDIYLFVEKGLKYVAEAQSVSGWPDSTICQTLVSKAEGLFIWASVLVNILRFDAFDPVNTLRDIVDNSRSGVSPEVKMEEMYAKALETCGKWTDPYFQRSYAAVIGAIVTAQVPLSLTAMQSLYRHDAELSRTFPSILKMLRPLLVGFDIEQRDGPIQIIHLSFRDFVTGKSQSALLSNQFRISLVCQHEEMALGCLRVLIDDMNESIPGVGLLDIDGEGIPPLDFSQVSEALLYSSQHWIKHLSEITREFPEQICQPLRTFASFKRLRQWIELVTCSSGYQKVRDLANLIELRVSNPKDILVNIDSDYFVNVLSRLASRLKYMNRLEEALSVLEDVVETCKTFAPIRQDSVNSSIIHSLQNVSDGSKNLGHHTKASNSIDKDAKINQSLGAFLPEASVSYLTMPFNNVADLDRREEAMKTIDEAVTLHRALGAIRPETFTAPLCSSLNGYLVCLEGLRRREEGMQLIEEAVNIRRLLGAVKPQNLDSNLGQSLNEISIRLGSMTRREEALKAVKEAVNCLRSLATARPEAFNTEIANSLSNLSVNSGNLGRVGEALKSAEEAVAINCVLAIAGQEAFNRDLAESLLNLSVRLGGFGLHEKALKAIDEAVDVYRSLAAARPEAYNSDLALSLVELSKCLSDLSRCEEALESVQEAVDIRRTLAATHPGEPSPDLAGALVYLTKYLRVLGRHEKALKTIGEVIDIYGFLISARRGFIAEFGESVNNPSNVLEDLGRLEKALETFNETVGTCPSFTKIESSGLATSLNDQSSRIDSTNVREQNCPCVPLGGSGGEVAYNNEGRQEFRSGELNAAKGGNGVYIQDTNTVLRGGRGGGIANYNKPGGVQIFDGATINAGQGGDVDISLSRSLAPRRQAETDDHIKTESGRVSKSGFWKRFKQIAWK